MFEKCIEADCDKECMCSGCGCCQEHHDAKPDVFNGVWNP